VTTIRNAKTKADLISAVNEENQTNTIRRRFNALGETFEGVVLSNWEQIGRTTTQVIKDKYDNDWYLVRVLAKDESDSMRLSPYENRLPREEIYRRINDHRQAQIAKDMIGDGKVPAHGTIWQCRYAGKNYTPPIILEQYLRDGSSADKIEAMKDPTGTKKSPNDPKPSVKTVAEIKASSTTPSPGYDGTLKAEHKAKFFRAGNRTQDKTISVVVLHATDGWPGDGKAAATIRRFHTGPTTSYRWYNKYTQKKIKNPKCSTVLAVDGSLPDGTVCHPTRKKVETMKKTSIHYAVDQGGNIIQGLLEKDIANHVGTRAMNNKSVGIEMTGFLVEKDPGKGQGATTRYAKMYNDKLLNAVADLVADILKRNQLPLNRETVRGHEEFSTSRVDPGTKLGPGHWDWDDFIKRVQQRM